MAPKRSVASPPEGPTALPGVNQYSDCRFARSGTCILVGSLYVLHAVALSPLPSSDLCGFFPLQVKLVWLLGAGAPAVA